MADDAFKFVIESRMKLLQCVLRTDGSYEDSGCIADCVANHGASGGECVISRPVALSTGTAATLHCECYYE